MPNILENCDLMISYKLPILNVVNALGFHSLVIYFLFWQFGITTLKNSLIERLQSRYAWDQSFPVPAKETFKSRFHPDSAPNLVLNLSWSWSYLTSIPVLLLSRFHPGLGPGLFPILIPILSRLCSDPDVILVLSPLRSKGELGLVAGSGCILTISR